MILYDTSFLYYNFFYLVITILYLVVDVVFVILFCYPGVGAYFEITFFYLFLPIIIYLVRNIVCFSNFILFSVIIFLYLLLLFYSHTRCMVVGHLCMKFL